MLDELFDTIERLQKRIEKHKRYFDAAGKPEARTRAALIDPMLSALEWDVSDPAQVEIEPNTETKSDNYGPDYALLDDKGNRVLFLEAKRLTDKKPAMAQAIAYTVEENRHSRTNVQYCGSTNGDMWEIYDIRAVDPVVLELVVSREKAAKCALKFLSLWRPSLRDGLFVPVRSVGPAGSEVVRAEPKPRTITPPAPDGPIQAIYQALRERLLKLGDDVQEKETRNYVAFKRRRNFAAVQEQRQKIVIHLLSVDPNTIDLEEEFLRRRNHCVARRGPCVEVTICSHEDLRRAEPLLKKSYDAAS